MTGGVRSKANAFAIRAMVKVQTSIKFQKIKQECLHLWKIFKRRVEKLWSSERIN